VTCHFPVGMAGFEPAASSSRIRPWKAADLWTLLKMQVRALACVCMEWYSEIAISRSSPGFLQRLIVAHGSCCIADWPLRCTLLALADELREAMAELRLRGSPPTRCALFLNAASSAAAVYVCPVSVGLLEFPALVNLVTLAGIAGRVRVRGWDSNPGPADYESSQQQGCDNLVHLQERHGRHRR
jgi:hypothetical protein